MSPAPSLLGPAASCLAGTGNCAFANNTAPCNDGSACTTSDTCSGGSYTGTAVNCGDSNTCTADNCDTSSGACSNPNLADYTACGGTNFCFGGVCQACLVWDKEALATNGSELDGIAVDGTGLLGAGFKATNGDDAWLRSANQ